MNGYWILAGCIYALVAVVMVIDEHRCGSGWLVKIACIFWLPVLIAGLFITICQDLFEELRS
jgi:hypothetical protein